MPEICIEEITYKAYKVRGPKIDKIERAHLLDALFAVALGFSSGYYGVGGKVSFRSHRVGKILAKVVTPKVKYTIL